MERLPGGHLPGGKSLALSEAANLFVMKETVMARGARVKTVPGIKI